MYTTVQKPSCFSLFEPTAPECIQCGMQAECMTEQEQRLSKNISTTSISNSDTGKPVTTEVETQQPISNPKPHSKLKRKETAKPNRSHHTGDTQFIPQHARTPLTIPPVGSTIRTTHNGNLYEALIVDDPSNKRGDGRSILFNGTVYRTLTAAAHAISPGIHSGSVWRQV